MLRGKLAVDNQKSYILLLYFCSMQTLTSTKQYEVARFALRLFFWLLLFWWATACSVLKKPVATGTELPVELSDSPLTDSHSKKSKSVKSKQKSKRSKKEAEILPATELAAKPEPKPLVVNKPKAAPAGSQAQKVIQEAKTYLNTKYVYGGMSREGVDCSGFTSLAFQIVGIRLPRSSYDQSLYGKSIELTEVKPGDLLFFYAYKPGKVGHSALVIDTHSEIKFIHAIPKAGVVINSLAEPHWMKCYMGAKRVL